MESLHNQSLILVTVLEFLQERGLKALLFHREALKRYDHYNRISELCDYVLLDKVSKDDPFFIAAALNSGPRTLILTNDLLRQHNFALEDPYLQKVFTDWQMKSQVKCRILTMNGGRKPFLVFPGNYVIRATRTEKMAYSNCT